MIVTVTPNPALDLTYQLGPGGLGEPVEVHRARTVTLEASGKGVNVARALRSAGYDALAVLLAGGATGRHLLELLDEEGVPHRAVRHAGATRVNTTVLSPGRATLKLNAPGPELTPADGDALVAALAGALAGAAAGSWVLICGSVPAGPDPARTGPADLHPADLVTRLIGAARAHGCRCAVDTSGPALAAALVAGADLLAPNAGELAELARSEAIGTTAGPEGTAFTRVRRLAATIAARHGCHLLISLGPQGALWTDGTRTVHARGPAVIPVNTAGAGDALLAGWFATEPGTGGTIVPVGERLATAVRWGAAACLTATTVRSPAGPAAGDPPAGEVRLREWRPSPATADVARRKSSGGTMRRSTGST